MTNLETPDTSAQIKTERVIAERSKLDVESNKPLSLNKFDASGNLMADKKSKIPFM